jgi:hypothetical protein
MLKLLLLIFLMFSSLYSSDFSLIKKETSKKDPTLLVIGGIHGNEPGAYYAAEILAQNYDISKGNLWIIPNLNRESIMKNQRGTHGDMNRKFSNISTKDQDYTVVTEVKNIIKDPKVSLILNLHDGHGFYRQKYQNTIFNPQSWGQTCVIDQFEMQDCRFGDLGQIATKVSHDLNKKLLKNHHAFNVRNTKTKYFDEAMQLSLTYFSVTNNKPAFAIESSKNLSKLSEKVYYQLHAIESFMKIMNIKFSRNFTLTPKSLQKIIEKRGSVVINDNIILPLEHIKSYLSYIPLKSSNNTFKFSNHLGSMRKRGSEYFIFIGSKKIVALKPQIFELDTCKDVLINVDGSIQKHHVGEEFNVNEVFKVLVNTDIRVNVIGFAAKQKNERNLEVHKSKMQHRYAMDKKYKSYRVELYKKKKFCGLLIATFK